MSVYDVYFACCTPDGGVRHFLFENGALTEKSRLTCDRPMYLHVEDNRLHVLLRAPWEGNRHSGLQTYEISPEGYLKNGSDILDTRGIVACHLTHLNGRIYMTNYLSGNVSTNDGLLDVHEGHGPDPVRQEAPHTHFIEVSPDGHYLLSTDLGQDTVYVYDPDLRRVSSATVPAGQGVRHLAFSEDGKFVFAANEMGYTVTVFAWSDGKLNPLETVSSLFAPDPSNTSAAIRVRGDLVYVSQRGADAVSVMKWDGAHLRLKGVYPCGGNSPRDMILLEDKVICTNERSNDVSVLSIEGEALQDTGIRLLMPAPLCAVVRKR